MIQSLPLSSSSSSSFAFEKPNLLLLLRKYNSKAAVRTICCSKSSSSIPELEPFSRKKLDRIVKGPTLIEKAENDVADYCLTLEGDASYSCWRGYFELKDFEREAPKEEVEKLIIQAGGVKTLISCLHGISGIRKKKNEANRNTRILNEVKRKEEVEHFHVPDGLPKSDAELEEEEKAKMPDSPFTKLLRTRGKHPAWYSPAPDHETD